MLTQEMKAPQRQKYWKELTPDEKIERMHEVVQRLQSQNRTLSQTVDRLREHKHIDGEIVTPMKRHYGEDASGTTASDEVYF